MLKLAAGMTRPDERDDRSLVGYQQSGHVPDRGASESCLSKS
jgi:hypothetical protein